MSSGILVRALAIEGLRLTECALAGKGRLCATHSNGRADFPHRC